MTKENTNPRSIILMGGGGHTGVVADILIQQGRNIIAIFCPESPKYRNELINLPHYTNDASLIDFDNKEFVLINAIGHIPFSKLREGIANSRHTQHFLFDKVISDQAYVSSNVILGEGVHIMPGAIIQAGAVIGDHSIINSNSVIEHDCVIGKFNHIAPGATLCGNVTTEDDVFIGSGSTIIQDICIGKNSVIASSVNISKDIPSGVVVKNKNIVTVEQRII